MDLDGRLADGVITVSPAEPGDADARGCYAGLGLPEFDSTIFYRTAP